MDSPLGYLQFFGQDLRRSCFAPGGEFFVAPGHVVDPADFAFGVAPVISSFGS
jgi:hypothetical protein